MDASSDSGPSPLAPEGSPAQVFGMVVRLKEEYEAEYRALHADDHPGAQEGGRRGDAVFLKLEFAQ